MRGGDPDRRVPADHIVHGSVRRTGQALRVSVQLVEVANGRQIWADRYDATAADLHAVQDAIAARIARTLAVRVDEACLDVARRAPLASLDVYDCWLRGLECIRKGTVEADAEARRYFERALEIDPDYARAYSGLSLSHFNEWSCQAWPQWDEKERLAHDYAQRAVALDTTDPMGAVRLGPDPRLSAPIRRGGSPSRTCAAAQSQRHRCTGARRPVSGVFGRPRGGIGVREQGDALESNVPAVVRGTSRACAVHARS